MARENLEVALIKYNKKTWCKSGLLGFFIGLAVIVPGISGSTVAIIFKLYEQFLYAIGNLFKQFKRCFAFLLPIGLGVVLGILLGFFTVQKLLELLPFAVVCLFAGLMCGAFPAVKEEIHGAAYTAKRVALFAVGLFLPVLIGGLSAIFTAKGEGLGVQADKFADVNFGHVALALLFGAVLGITQIVPGLSASAFLMAVGWFNGIMESVSLTYWQANPRIFFVYFGLGIGFLLGIFLFSKLLTYLFSVARETAYFMIVGLSLGSIISMFCNSDILSVYVGWAQNGASPWEIFLGVLLFIGGAVGAYALVRYQRKKDAEAPPANEVKA